uniref:Uncharacterized protein n=1 Tax=Panagrolaimus sp. PS1159 TaxID=55785 RepID=A0AC35GKC1_9BILA
MAAVSTYSNATTASSTTATTGTTSSRLIPEDSQRRVTKHVQRHHQPAHFRPTTKPSERQRKMKRNQRINFVSTDGTTSGNSLSDCNSEDLQLGNEFGGGGDAFSIRLEQLMKKPENSDLEADCEDNNSTDVDTVSISGSIKHKNPIEGNENVSSDSKMELLNAKIRNLEKQLATVLSLNIKLKEENDRLKSAVTNQ